MKRTFLTFLLCGFAGLAMAQDCNIDSTIVQTGGVISPPPTGENNTDSLPDACRGEVYNLSFTINVPTEYSGFAINNVTIGTSNAISGLPEGLTYACEPANCVFPGGSLGCILVYGTVSASATTGVNSLGIAGTINTSLAPIPFTFPGFIAPGNYYLEVKAAGTCEVSGTDDPDSPVADLKNAPNPFTGLTNITVESRVSGLVQFEVFDLLGQRVYAENVRLTEGPNQFTFDAGELASGSYFYSIGNRSGKTTRMMVVNR